MKSLHENLAECHLSISRGKVWCRTCGSEQRVDPTNAIRFGWPKCCGFTMTIDHPDTWKDRQP
jgi:Zn finger protein HypA/HybF involved in hydrogenase expression